MKISCSPRKNALPFSVLSSILLGSTLPPTHSPLAEPCPHVSHPTRHWCFGYSLRPGLLFFSLCTVCLSLSLTCCGCCCLSSSVYVPYCSLPRGRRNVRARSQVLCLTAGRDKSHCVHYANQHFCASVLLAFLWKYCSGSNVWWCKY